MNWFRNKFQEILQGLILNFRDSLKWASVQMMACWAGIWAIYSQLPTDAMIWLAQWRVPMWMGIIQAVMTYLARVKAPKGGA
jgi:hypothetical protein